MTTGGLLVMILSVTSVVVLSAYCLYRVLTLPAPPEDGEDGADR
ncbi:hypothetical protein [Polyangium spumosum]|nr:hypothetical protein [Polyangium spumosum]